MVIIIDYGLGNRGSILNVLQRIGVAARISADPDEITSAERLILPGVGAFDTGMTNLHSRGLIEPIRRATLERGTPMLGVCLGMQLMCEGSAEGQLPGLGLVKGSCVRFDAAVSPTPIKIPHMGWAELDVARQSSLFAAAERPRFYFVHSYYVVCDDPAIVTATARHGVSFAAAFEQGPLLGVQFHPEKSHRFGMALMKAFAQVPLCARA